jgi:surfactin synthase thioesterase subunit
MLAADHVLCLLDVRHTVTGRLRRLNTTHTGATALLRMLPGDHVFRAHNITGSVNMLPGDHVFRAQNITGSVNMLPGDHVFRAQHTQLLVRHSPVGLSPPPVV